MKIQYHYNGRRKLDDLKTGTISNSGLGLQMIHIVIDEYLFENIL